MRPRNKRFLIWVYGLTIAVGLAGALVLSLASAVLHPVTDNPRWVDAIVVVAGEKDDRYRFAAELAKQGRTNTILISRPPRLSAAFAALTDPFCASSPLRAAPDRDITISCFAPDSPTTEGEAAAATRIASHAGHKSLLIVTYWGHVSRVRMYFSQCFDGALYVTDTPDPSSVSRRYALAHEIPGYFKAAVRPAC
ncbi:hypothetical protein DEQ16_15950 [Dietzia maris]|nr:hypothetical protein DEQ16_15950 [Dietzia maris]